MWLNFKQEAAVDWLTLSLVMNKILSQQTPFQEFQQHLQNFQVFFFPRSAVPFLEEDLFPTEMFHWKFMVIEQRITLNKGRESGFLPHHQTQNKIKHNLVAIKYN